MRYASLTAILLFMSASLMAADSPAKSQAVEAGTLTGQFIYDGEPPAPVELKTGPPIAGKVKLFDESLVVNPINHGIQNVVVQLYLEPEVAPPKPRDFKPATEVTLASPVERYEPRVLALRTDQKLLVSNPDTSAHNVKVDFSASDPVNLLLKADSSVTISPTKRELLPTPISDTVHPWKRGFVVVTDHPFVAISDADGKFAIDHLPPGEWTFRVWHERSGYVTKAGDAVWPLGRVKIKIKPGANDLGKVLVSPKMFDRDR